MRKKIFYPILLSSFLTTFQSLCSEIPSQDESTVQPSKIHEEVIFYATPEECENNQKEKKGYYKRLKSYFSAKNHEKDRNLPKEEPIKTKEEEIEELRKLRILCKGLARLEL